MTPKPKLSFWQRIVAFFKGSASASSGNWRETSAERDD